MARTVPARNGHLTHNSKVPDRPWNCHAGAVRPTGKTAPDVQ